MVFGCCGNKSSYDTTKDTKINADLTSGQHPVFLQQVSLGFYNYIEKNMTLLVFSLRL